MSADINIKDNIPHMTLYILFGSMNTTVAQKIATTRKNGTNSTVMTESNKPQTSRPM